MEAPTPAVNTVKLGPVAPGERIEIIDVLRGFALFGILLVNMEFFRDSIFVMMAGVKDWVEPWNRAASWFISTFGQGKFFILFSFLFGLGFALQLLRGEARGINPVLIYRRRLFVLLVIGAVHAFLIWMGDILLMYALIGFLLLLFRRRSEKALLRWAVAFFLLPVVLMAGFTGLIQLGRMVPEGRAEIEKGFAEQAERMEQHLAASRRAYAAGSYPEVTRQRAFEVSLFYFKWGIFFIPYVLGMFLLGLYIGRRGIFRDIEPHLPWIRRMRWPALALGLAGNILNTAMMEISNPAVPSPPMLLGQVGYILGGPALTFFYVSTLMIWWQSETGRRRLKPLAAVGRMALTNYLTHSIVCTLIFYGYGLGYFGKIGPAQGIGLTVLIYSLQIPFSNWWLGRFRFGPAEWLWRTLTYGKAQPMRLAS
jgi:uncharacterized protein